MDLSLFWYIPLFRIFKNFSLFVHAAAADPRTNIRPEHGHSSRPAVTRYFGLNSMGMSTAHKAFAGYMTVCGSIFIYAPQMPTAATFPVRRHFKFELAHAPHSHCHSLAGWPAAASVRIGRAQSATLAACKNPAWYWYTIDGCRRSLQRARACTCRFCSAAAGAPAR